MLKECLPTKNISERLCKNNFSKPVSFCRNWIVPQFLVGCLQATLSMIHHCRGRAKILETATVPAMK